MANDHQWHESPGSKRPERPFSDGVFVHLGRASDIDRDARLFWRTDVDPSVVVAEAEPIPPSHPDAFDIAHFGSKATMLSDAHGRELVVLTDHTGEIQLDIVGVGLGSGPVRLRYRVEGLEHLDTKLRTLRRLQALCRLGRFPKSLFPPEKAGGKWASALQAYDGLIAGASQRDIALVLFGDRLVREEWNGRSDFLRLRVQRLLSFARKMVNGGYLTLLG